MKIIEQSFEIFPFVPERIFLDIEKAARICYKSEDKICQGSAEKLIKNLISKEHYSPLEFGQITIKIITDRGVSHELVRHRIASFAQESTRYCNYSNNKFGNELTFIKPVFWQNDSVKMHWWEECLKQIEKTYFQMIDSGASPQEARSILPNSLKTEIIISTNIREWLHIFKMRTSNSAHPQIRHLFKSIQFELNKSLPIFF